MCKNIVVVVVVAAVFLIIISKVSVETSRCPNRL
jgi:hypothetical protein